LTVEDQNKIIWFNDIDYAPVAWITLWWWTADGVNLNTPWISAPQIDANISINNIPKWEDTTPDLVWWSTDIVRSSTDYNTVAWTAGSIKLADWTSFSVDAGNTGNISAVNYIYYDWTSTLKKTTTPQDAVWANKIMVCVAKNSTSPSLAQFQAFWTLWNWVFITADNIAANTITSNELASNSIDGMTITGATIRTSSSWKRVQLDTSYLRLYDWSDNLCWTISWDTVDFVSLWSRQTMILWWEDVMYLKADAWIIANSPYLYTGSIQVCPWYSNVDIWDTSTAFNNLYLQWKIDFDNWDWILTEVGWRPKWRANWWTAYYIPTVTWASTNKTTNASIKVSIWWTEYYINVLAA
jgi:hypothetical protein